MKRKTGFWQLRVIVPGICLFLIMVTNNVYGSEFSTGQTEEMLQEIRSEQIQESVQNKNPEEEKRRESQNNGMEFSEETDISETPAITSEMLHFFYQKSRTLSVHGDGHTIVICGEDIVNDKNELCTQIAFHREAEGTVFELNEGKVLCGPVTLCLDQPVGT